MFPKPDLELSADRLHERVDGAAPALRRMGCERLLYWRFETPPADLELLRFATVEGARWALGQDAGKERTPHAPGEEGWANEQCVFFRVQAIEVRLIGDDTSHQTELSVLARRVERAVLSRELP